MPKRILDVGNCGPDHHSILSFFRKHFDAQVDQTNAAEDTLTAMRGAAYDLVVVNRKLDIDYTDGLDVIKQIKADEGTAGVPVMLITNYDDHQDLAIAAGAVRGFGKLELEEPEVLERVKQILG